MDAIFGARELRELLRRLDDHLLERRGSIYYFGWTGMDPRGRRLEFSREPTMYRGHPNIYAVRVEDFWRVGGHNEHFSGSYGFDDVDFEARARALLRWSRLPLEATMLCANQARARRRASCSSWGGGGRPGGVVRARPRPQFCMHVNTTSSLSRDTLTNVAKLADPSRPLLTFQHSQSYRYQLSRGCRRWGEE